MKLGDAPWVLRLDKEVTASLVIYGALGSRAALSATEECETSQR